MSSSVGISEFTIQMKNGVFWVLRRVALVKTEVSPKRRFLQEPHGAISQKTTFFVVPLVKTSNLT
jgi:hypothetical protein